MNEFLSITTHPAICGFLQFLIALPVAAGLILFLIPEKYMTVKGIISVIIGLIACYMTISVFSSATQMTSLSGNTIKGCLALFGIEFVQDAARYVTFTFDSLSKLMIVFASLFTTLVISYSIIYSKNRKVKHFYSWVLITLGCSVGALLSDNLLLFLTFWGILGITLYKLIPGRDAESSAAAKKTLILIGASDSIMILGIALLWKLTGTLSMNAISAPEGNILSVTAFLALLIGSFTKAGAFPFHSWVPDYSMSAPATSTALLPASLDKLLGIYFLARITTGMFVLNNWLRFILLLIGGITIISAVMMALIQHNYKKLLGFHAVSQVGYMVIGFGLGSAVGVAAGIFHMINNAIYKSGLFLSAGSIEYRTGKETIDDLGGLSKTMPVTFIASLVFAMSISGIPPFNGFASKWMIYQGIIDFGIGSDFPNKLWILWLGFAVLGSALTLASFIKFIGGIFLSRIKSEFNNIKEVPALMWIPQSLLALLCIVFGVFATNYIVPKLFMPITGEFTFSGFWNSSFVSLLVLISIILGILIYLATILKKFRREDSFIGGEKLQDQTGYSTPEFYKSISEIGFFSWMYEKAEKKWFDIYDLIRQFVLWLNSLLSKSHTGVLTNYIIWVFVGLIIMLLIMI
jgi:formate hydrogenlyase subunit 3/multisubunit Na+/H+ antiporter MnhD subunit